VSRKTCRGRFSLNRTLPLVYSPALGAVTPSHRRCVNYIGCQFRDEWSSSLPVLCTSHWHQRRRRTSLSTFDSSLSMVVVLCVDLPTVASPGVRGRGHCISNIRVGRQNRLVMCGPPSTTPAAGKFSQRICHVLRVQFGDSCVWVGSNCLRLPPPRGDTTAFEQDARCSTETQVFWRHAGYGMNAYVILSVCHETVPRINESTRRNHYTVGGLYEARPQCT